MRLLLILLPLFLFACHTSPENSYYTLAPSYDYLIPPHNKGIALSKVSIPDTLDRPQLVMKSDTARIHILEYNRWSESLEDMVYRVLGDDVLLRQTGKHIRPEHTKSSAGIIVNINEFIFNETGQVTLKASWNYNDADFEEPHTHRIFTFNKSISADKNNMGSIIIAMNHLLGYLADAIIIQSK